MGCAGAARTKARTLTCMSPPPLALHPCLDLYGFRDSDRAPVFLFVFVHPSSPGGCKARAGSGLRLLVLIVIEPCLEAFEPSTSWTCPDLTAARFGVGSGSRPLVFFRLSPGWMPPILNEWTYLDQTSANFGWVCLKACMFLGES